MRIECLVIADGFYEWQRTGKAKVPYRILLKSEEPFAFAGIWSTVQNSAGEEAHTFAILTTEANDLVAPIHNRMPVILHADDEDDWLNPQLAIEQAQELLVPYPPELITAYEVSAKVNSPKNNAREVLQPIAESE